MIAPASIAEILGLGTSVRTVGELESAVAAGLPKRALEKLSARGAEWPRLGLLRCHSICH